MGMQAWPSHVERIPLSISFLAGLLQSVALPCWYLDSKRRLLEASRDNFLVAAKAIGKKQR
jgi:hypothetical protein